MPTKTINLSQSDCKFAKELVKDYQLINKPFISRQEWTHKLIKSVPMPKINTKVTDEIANKVLTKIINNVRKLPDMDMKSYVMNALMVSINKHETSLVTVPHDRAIQMLTTDERKQLGTPSFEFAYDNLRDAKELMYISEHPQYNYYYAILDNDLINGFGGIKHVNLAFVYMIFQNIRFNNKLRLPKSVIPIIKEIK